MPIYVDQEELIKSLLREKKRQARKKKEKQKKARETRARNKRKAKAKSRSRSRTPARSSSRTRASKTRASKTRANKARSRSQKQPKKNQRQRQRKVAANQKKRARSASRAAPKQTNKKSGTSWFLNRLWSSGKTNNKKAPAKRRLASRPLYSPVMEPNFLRGTNFNSFIHKVRRRIVPNGQVDRASMVLMDKMMKNVLHEIAQQAGQKMGRKKVLNEKILLRGMRRLMPRQFRERADEVGQRALERFRQRSLHKHYHH